MHFSFKKYNSENQKTKFEKVNNSELYFPVYHKAKINFEPFTRNSIKIKLSDILEFKDATTCYSILYTMAHNLLLQ
jgi:hypothetical protein